MQWETSIDDALSAVDAKLQDGYSDPVAALWDEHSGGMAETLTDCGGILERFAKTPPDATARGVLRGLQAACEAMASATDDSGSHTFDSSGYERAKAQLRRALAELEAVAP